MQERENIGTDEMGLILVEMAVRQLIIRERKWSVQQLNLAWERLNLRTPVDPIADQAIYRTASW